LKHEVSFNFNDFEGLLNKESILQKLQTKWIKNLGLGNISVIDQLYSLKATQNKRQLIYKNNKLVATRPFIINKVDE
jgi:hypothetical protein